MKKTFIFYTFFLALFSLIFILNACEDAEETEIDETEIDTDGQALDISADESAITTDTASLKYIDDDMVEYGKLLVQIGGCNNCHSPKVMTDNGFMPDESRLLSGHPADEKLPKIDLNMVGKDQWVLTYPMQTAYVGHWGVAYAANLTAHQTGLGDWDKEQFVTTLRSGKHMGADKGRNIMPPMPWFNLAETSDTDLEAIWMYLQSLPPVNNDVPDHIKMEELKNKPEMLANK